MFELPDISKQSLYLILGASFICTSLPALADGYEQDSKSWMLGAGLGVMNTPRYLGSNHNKTKAMPMLKATYRTDYGTLGIGEDGGNPRIRWGFSPNRNSELGVQLGRDEGRREQDDPSNLNGLGNVKTTVEYGIFASQRFDGLKLKMSANKGSSSGHGGIVLNIKAEHEFKLTESLGLQTGLGMSWASRKYMQRYFGVSAQQSADSGLKTYTAGSGVRDIGVSVGLNWRPAQNWMLLTKLGLSRLQGDAKDSPITRKATQSYIATGFIYLW